MPEQHEGFALDVGSKLLFGAIMLTVFGVIALVMVPLATFGMENGPGIMPGLIVLVIAIVLGALGGLLLGYAAKHGTYDVGD